VGLLDSLFGDKRKRAAAHNDKGYRMACAGDLDGAIREYKRAVSIHPDYPLAYNNLGMALWNKRQPKQAVQAFQKAVSIDPNDWRGHSNLGNALAAVGNLDLAIAAYTHALSIDPGNKEVQNNLEITIREKEERDGRS
jgi:Flp pilus assembly protein TadD